MMPGEGAGIVKGALTAARSARSLASAHGIGSLSVRDG